MSWIEIMVGRVSVGGYVVLEKMPFRIFSDVFMVGSDAPAGFCLFF